jgi:O-antigen ligase
MTLNLLLILSISAVVVHQLRRDYIKGVAISVLFLIALPDALSFQLGTLFELNVYRVILILLILFRQRNTEDYGRLSSIPAFHVSLLVLLSCLVSVYVSTNVKFSLNKYIGFSLLVFVFYIILIRSIKDENDVDILLKHILAGLLIVSVLGLAERYLKFSVIKYLDSEQYAMILDLNGRVTSTYPHPILLGCGLAMGVPLAMYSIQHLKRESFTSLYPLTALLLVATIYVTFSRSAWISLGVCLAMGLFLLPADLKKYIYLILVLLVALVYFREGVYKTIDNLYDSTFDVNTIKGSSYSYRTELWRVAFSKTGESATRFLFGFGEGAHELMDLSGRLSYDPNRIVSFKSWDNEYACILLEKGMVGLALYVMMNVYILVKMAKGAIRMEGREKILVYSLMISNCVFLFTLNAVKMFSVQMVFLFWTNVAIAMRTLDLRGIRIEREVQKAS